jgi:4-amino-4-deoxy-L-arabinose transferase-like glycosyltransferase
LHQGLRLGRPWLALVLLAFCLPLFVGLGVPDLETDEAIYSFAVDEIVKDGNWLEPKSSPSTTTVFLEKPPLKFWLVAAPIKAGLLPHTEFGLRFVDVVLTGAAFVYVFAVGVILAGPVCGAVAVLMLFIHWPLVFAHGLRTNNMEASQVLCYAAGVFHFLRWSAANETRARRRHAVVLSLAFVLGFMTKFVAALFLPFTLGLAILAVPRVRTRFFAEWRLWLACIGLIVLLCAPWFVYSHVRFGEQFWQMILGDAVFKRLTAYLDPTHLHPWYWYLQQMWQEFGNERTQWLVAAGLLTLLVQTIRRRWFEGMVVLLWAVVPMIAISAGTSKLYHYAYPYLPPVALAAGYLVALVVMLAPAPVRRALGWAEDRLAAVLPGVAAWGQRDRVRRVASGVIVAVAALAIASVALGGVRLAMGSVILKSSGVVRPLAVMLVMALVTRSTARLTHLIVGILVFASMPMAAYRGQLGWLEEGKAPIRTTAACLQQVQSGGGQPPGLYIDMPEGIWHPLYYYFRRVQPLTEATAVDEARIDSYLVDPATPRPILIADARWREHQAWRARAGRPPLSPPLMPFLNSLLLMPGPYARCSTEAVLRSTP